MSVNVASSDQPFSAPVDGDGRVLGRGFMNHGVVVYWNLCFKKSEGVISS